MKENKYRNSKISILADSIRTFEGSNPDGYTLFYTGDALEETGVRSVADTWWSIVAEHFGAKILVNNSWSGSRATRLPENESLFPSGISDERAGGLAVGDEQPDIIFLWLVTNDMLAGAKPRRENETDDKTLCFDTAYETILQKLEKNYPKARIFCFTTGYGVRSDIPNFCPTYPLERSEKYNRVIRELAKKHGLTVIELFDEKKKYDTADEVHPTRAGMRSLAAAVIDELEKAE